jgi:hypothetical protein
MLIYIVRLVVLLLIAIPAAAEDYPGVGIAKLRATCAQRQDIPAQSMLTYCNCYVELIQQVVPWRDFLLLDTAIASKGLTGLDAEDKTILGKTRQVSLFCQQRATRQP